MGNSDTVNKILHAAIILFSERGFAETSLRTITGMADVNLAAVNYHFGNKKSLIQAVFGHFLKPFVHTLEHKLDQLEAATDPDEAIPLENLLRILVESLFVAGEEIDEKPQRFMRLLSLAYTQSQDHLRQYLSRYYKVPYSRYVNQLKRSLPELDNLVFYWRINFLLGSLIFTLSSFESIQAILSAEQKMETRIDEAVDILVPAMAGMLGAPNS